MIRFKYQFLNNIAMSGQKAISFPPTLIEGCVGLYVALYAICLPTDCATFVPSSLQCALYQLGGDGIINRSTGHRQDCH